jgi:DNA-binding CsgD family transcriptional regulator
MNPETKAGILATVRDQCLVSTLAGRTRYPGVPRTVTFKQEMVYRLRHQDFFGLTMSETAEVLGLKRWAVWETMKRLKDKAPQLFPVLSKRMAHAYRMYSLGYTTAEIGEEMNVGERYVRRILRHLHDRRNKLGIFFRSDAGKKLQYKPYMDKIVKERW